MLLPAHFDPAFDDMRRAGDGRLHIAARPDARAFLEPAVGGQRFLDGQDRAVGLCLDLRAGHGAARGEMAFGGHKKDRLALVMQRAVRQQRLVVQRGRAVALGRQVVEGPDPNDPGRGADRVEVKRGQPPGCDR